MIHVTTVGPAKDLNAVRSPKSGALKATRSGLEFVRQSDGKRFGIFIEGPQDVARLVVELLDTFQAAKATPDDLEEARAIVGEYVAQILTGGAGTGSVRPRLYRSGGELAP